MSPLLQVKMSVYATYLKAIGLSPGLAVIFLAIVAKFMDLGASFWLSRWSDDMGKFEKLVEESKAYSNMTYNSTMQITPPPSFSQGSYLGIYAVLGFFQGLCAF